MAPAAASHESSRGLEPVSMDIDEMEESASEASQSTPTPLKRSQKVERSQTVSKKRELPLKDENATPSLATMQSDDQASESPVPVSKKRKVERILNFLEEPSPSEDNYLSSKTSDEEASSTELKFTKKKKEPKKAKKQSGKRVASSSDPSSDEGDSRSSDDIKTKAVIGKARKKYLKKSHHSEGRAAPPSTAAMQSSDEEDDLEAPKLVMKKRKVETAEKKLLKQYKTLASSSAPMPNPLEEASESDETPLDKKSHTKGASAVEKTSAKVGRKSSEKKEPVWYFKSPATPSSLETATAFQRTFHRALYHVIAVGNLLHDLQSLPDGKWTEPAFLSDGTLDLEKLKEKKKAVKTLLSTDARTKDISDLNLLRYLEMALATWSDGDKYMPLRMHAPSMLLISTLIPSYEASLDVKEKSEASKKKDTKTDVKMQAPSPFFSHVRTLFRLALTRVFGVGNPALIRTLASVTTSTDVTTLIESSLPAEKKSLSRSVYGQMIIPRKAIPKIIDGCEKLAFKLDEKIHQQKEKMTFEQVEEVIVGVKIHSMQRGGILTWLLGCDLAALGYCAEATWEDLARKMGIVDGDEDEVEDEGKSKGKGKGKGKGPAKKGPKPKQAAGTEEADEEPTDEPPKKAKATKKSCGGGAGPGKGIELVLEMAQKLELESTPNSNTSSNNPAQTNLTTAMQSKTSFIHECKAVVEVLNEEFKDQFEALGMSDGVLPRDMEHFLCKIARMERRGKFEFAK